MAGRAAVSILVAANDYALHRAMVDFQPRSSWALRCAEGGCKPMYDCLKATAGLALLVTITANASAQPVEAPTNNQEPSASSEDKEAAENSPHDILAAADWERVD